MKSLIRTQSPSVPVASEPQAQVVDEKVAQCCAKVSKTVAGCHD